MDPRSVAAEAFERRFGTVPQFIARAPGRVNLIGEHTDYNDGFVFPMAIDRAIWIALRPRGDGRVVVHSLDLDDTAQFSLQVLKNAHAGWSEYLKGVAWSLQEEGHELRGWEGMVAGDVPIGAGLSSSAALELAAGRAFAVVSGLSWDPAVMARICQRAENDWVGVRCGIMDQLISAAGRPEHALLIDCRSLDWQAVPLPPELAVVVLDTGTRRGLSDSAYNERREQCQAAARFFGVAALRDVSPARLEARSEELANALGSAILRRARHVVTENMRTLAAAEAAVRGDLYELGRLLDASHASLRDDFEVSGATLNTIASCARRRDTCYGARMTGAGFGGCAVAIVEADGVESFSAGVASCYEEVTGIEPDIYVCAAVEGAEIVRYS